MKPDHGDIWDALGEIYGIAAQTADDVADLKETVGEPGDPEGDRKPSGVFAHLSGHEKRLRRFERLYERAFGGALVAAPLLGALWWLAGDRIGRLLHG